MTPVDVLLLVGIALAAVYVFGLVMAVATVVIATERSRKKREVQCQNLQQRRVELGRIDESVLGEADD